MANDAFGCAVVAEALAEWDDEPTQVTRLLQALDECLEESQANLDDAGDKADRLRQRATRRPRRVRELLTPLPRKARKGAP